MAIFRQKLDAKIVCEICVACRFVINTKGFCNFPAKPLITASIERIITTFWDFPFSAKVPHRQHKLFFPHPKVLVVFLGGEILIIWFGGGLEASAIFQREGELRAGRGSRREQVPSSDARFLAINIIFEFSQNCLKSIIFYLS